MSRSVTRPLVACTLWMLVGPALFAFESSNVDLLSQLTLSQLGGGSAGNDIWGWTDSSTGKEYAIFGRSNGTSFVDISDPTQPAYLGNLPTQTGSSAWRDMKVYQDHAFVVSDNNGSHGMQVFDLTRLRNVTSPQTFSVDALHTGFTDAHNIAINEDTGYAYVVGSNRYSGGMYFIDISNPTSPQAVGGFSGDGYTHDTQVVTYHGPDANFQGREIAFNSNEDTLTVVDVTSKTSPSMLARQGYPQSSYTHQGWLSEDQRYFFMNDEGDEINGASRTRTHVWDVAQLDNPQYLGYHNGEVRTIDHNLYVKGNFIYEANYTSGLRILKINDPADPVMGLEEVAFFDTYSTSNSISYNGAWSVYPFFESGNVIVSDISNGLFVLRPDLIDSDLNGDGTIGCADIDLLINEIATGGSGAIYDLNGDGQVDLADRDAWLLDAGQDNLPGSNGYQLGDANLDGVVDGTDFNEWNAHKFTSQASWCAGDFTADGRIDGSDFNEWNSHKFTSASSQVPEPVGIVMSGWLLCWLGVRRRPSQKWACR